MVGFQQLAAVALGGSLGALGRHLTTWAAIKVGVADPRWATLCVNVVGCIAIGWLLESLLRDRPLHNPARLMLVTGLLGSLTTFSTFSYETWLHISGSRFVLAGVWITAHLFLGLIGVWVGASIAGSPSSPGSIGVGGQAGVTVNEPSLNQSRPR